MFVIGVDPHKGSHTAAALSSTEEVIAEVRIDADAKQLEHLPRVGRGVLAPALRVLVRGTGCLVPGGHGW